MSNYILVVDDEPDVRQLFKITLNMAGFRTEIASNGEEAMEAIGRQAPRLIVLDLMMPRLDGFGVLKRLRDEKPNGDIRVLVATAKTLNDDDKRRLGDWPVVGVLNKGELDIAQMVQDVQRLITAPAPVAPNGPSQAEKTPANDKAPEHKPPNHKPPGDKPKPPAEEKSEVDKKRPDR